MASLVSPAGNLIATAGDPRTVDMELPYTENPDVLPPLEILRPMVGLKGSSTSQMIFESSPIGALFVICTLLHRRLTKLSFCLILVMAALLYFLLTHPIPGKRQRKLL